MADEKQLGELKEQMEAISKAEERLNQVLKLMGTRWARSRPRWN